MTAQLCGILFAKVESPQSNEHVALLRLVTEVFIRHLLFPLLLPLVPSGAVQTQSCLHHLFKTQAAVEKCLSPVPSGGIYNPALPCALAEGCLPLFEAGNHVHETFITSDFGRTSYKMP